MKYILTMCCFALGGLVAFAANTPFVSATQLQRSIAEQLATPKENPAVEQYKQQIQEYHGSFEGLVKQITGIGTSNIHSLWYKDGTFLIISCIRDIGVDYFSALYVRNGAVIRGIRLTEAFDDGKKFLRNHTDGLMLLVDRDMYNTVREKHQHEELERFNEFAKSQLHLPTDAYLSVLRTYIIDQLSWPQMGTRQGIVFIGITKSELVMIVEEKDPSAENAWSYSVLHQQPFPDRQLRENIKQDSLLTAQDLQSSSLWKYTTEPQELASKMASLKTTQDLIWLLTKVKGRSIGITNLMPVYMGKTALETTNLTFGETHPN